jgi:hypothetical protein
VNTLSAPEGWAVAAEADSSSTLGSSIKAAAKAKGKKQKQKAKVVKSSAAVKEGAKRTRGQRSGSQKGKSKQTATQSLQQKSELPPHRAVIMVYAQAAAGDARLQMRLHKQPATAAAAAVPALPADAHTNTMRAGTFSCVHSVTITLLLDTLRNV